MKPKNLKVQQRVPSPRHISCQCFVQMTQRKTTTLVLDWVQTYSLTHWLCGDCGSCKEQDPSLQYTQIKVQWLSLFVKPLEPPLLRLTWTGENYPVRNTAVWITSKRKMPKSNTTCAVIKLEPSSDSEPLRIWFCWVLTDMTKTLLQQHFNSAVRNHHCHQQSQKVLRQMFYHSCRGLEFMNWNLTLTTLGGKKSECFPLSAEEMKHLETRKVQLSPAKLLWLKWPEDMFKNQTNSEQKLQCVHSMTVFNSSINIINKNKNKVLISRKSKVKLQSFFCPVIVAELSTVLADVVYCCILTFSPHSTAQLNCSVGIKTLWMAHSGHFIQRDPTLTHGTYGCTNHHAGRIYVPFSGDYTVGLDSHS